MKDIEHLKDFWMVSRNTITRKLPKYRNQYLYQNKYSVMISSQ